MGRASRAAAPDGAAVLMDWQRADALAGAATMMRAMTTPEDVRRIDRGGAATAARVLGRAFVDDPGWIHIFPDASTRAAQVERLLTPTVGEAYAPLGECWVVADREGAKAAAIWAPPGRHAIPWWTTAKLFPRLAWQIRRRVPQALELFRLMDDGHPHEPHYYLAALGVDPAHQGRGHGVRVITPVLDRCDATGTLAWLESANPKNHSFYRRLGFELVREATVKDGPTMTFFARKPR
jgi:GNAT superfamily N-acetyltransferase